MLLCLLATIVVTGVLMNRTRLGAPDLRHGRQPRRGVAPGLNLLRLHFCVYGYMGIHGRRRGGSAGADHPVGGPNSLLGFELTVLAAVVLGGTSMSGGRGSLTGTLLGVVLLAFLQNGLTLLQRLGLLAPGVQRRDHFDQHQHHRLERKRKLLKEI